MAKEETKTEKDVKEVVANLKAQAYDAIREIDMHTVAINQIRQRLQNINEAIAKIENKLKEEK